MHSMCKHNLTGQISYHSTGKKSFMESIPLLFHFRNQIFYLPFLEATKQKSQSESTRDFLLSFSFPSKHGDREKPWRTDKGRHNQVKWHSRLDGRTMLPERI